MNKRLAVQRTAMYRAMRDAHPEYFGDPLRYYDDAAYRGPAYGEREKGGGLVGAVIGVVAAVATGGASLGFSTIASTLSTISLVTGVVGAVTGNKTFAKIGMLAGMGSAFMSLSSSGVFGEGLQGWAKEANSAFQGMTGNQVGSTAQSINDAASAGSDVTGGSGLAATDPTGTVATANTASGVEAAAGDLNLQGASNTIDTALASRPDGLINTASEGLKAGGEIGLNASGEVGLTAANTGTSLYQPSAESMMQYSQIPTSNAMPSLWDNLATYSNKYGKLIEMGGQGVKFVGDLLKPDLSDQQAKLMEAQAGLYDARTAAEQAKLANANAIPDISTMFRATGANPFKESPSTAAGVRPAGLIQTRSSS